MKFLILTALVFGIFAISLGVIPADADRYIGTENAWIDVSSSFGIDWGEPLQITLHDNDMNKDSTVAEKILLHTAYDKLVLDSYEEDRVYFPTKVGSMPWISSSDSPILAVLEPEANPKFCQNNSICENWVAGGQWDDVENFSLLIQLSHINTSNNVFDQLEHEGLTGALIFHNGK